MDFIVLFLVIVALKFLLNFSQLIKARKLRDRYFQSVQNTDDSFSDYIAPAKQLFQEADIPQIIVFDEILRHRVRVSENLLCHKLEFTVSALKMFDESISVFRMRMLESLSPAFWLKFVLFIPTHLMQYLKLPTESVFARTLQVLYWLTTPLLIVFRNDICAYIIALIERLQ